MTEPDGTTLYARVGGEPFFRALVDRFYEAVERDPLLRPLYPPNLEPGKTNLAGFLAQYWGGPPRYSARRGHPRLRMRHARFPIGRPQRDAWLRHMTDAARTSSASPEDVAALIAYFESAATMLVNRFDAPVPTSASELHVLQQLDPGTPPPGLEPTS
jgi:hemoglobin